MTELRAKIRAVLLADSTLTDLLASATAIYHKRPPEDVDLPALIYRVENDSPNLQLSGYGDSELTIIIDAASTAPGTNDAIVDALDGALFDACVAGGLNTDNYKVRYCRRVSSVPMPTGLVDDSGNEIEQRSTEWRLRIAKL